MKRTLIILFISLVTTVRLFAQEEEQEPDGNQKIRDKMSEYIQKRLNLSDAETQKFGPIFRRYFKEWRTTLRENRGDRLVLQQKIIDLRIRYRTEFREILGEKRGNQIYDHQERFIKEMQEVGRQRLGGKRLRNNKMVIRQ